MENRKIAVIDEDTRILRNLEEILTISGYSPIVINDAFSAVDTIIQHKPDVILMELKMPRKNGFELTDAINRVFDTKRAPIIAMSEFFKDEFLWLLNACGIKRWIRKPFQPLDVIWAIENEIGEDNQWNMGRRLAGVEVMT
jgi:two-component system, response regulator PdtaR